MKHALQIVLIMLLVAVLVPVFNVLSYSQQDDEKHLA